VDEQTRVADVYRRYDDDPALRAKWSSENAGNRYLQALRERTLERLLAAEGLLPLAERRILDVGCGTGDFLRELCSRGAAPGLCHGVDILPARIDRARSTLPAATFVVADARSLPFDDASFDLVSVNMVFGSILADDVALSAAAEMQRVLAPDGAVLWLEHRYPNPWNPAVRRYTRRDLRRLFPGFELRARSISPLPPLVRRLGRATSVVAPLLEAVPPLRVDYLAVLRRLR
jgi:ubiquinone/menaquinone biosynthesis C-methylase UbiE